MTPIILDLPMPPSTNQIWRARRNGRGGKPGFYLDPKYVAWKLECDGCYWASALRVREPLEGAFRLTVTLDRDRMRGDADNRIKPVQDWLQRAGIVLNDNQIKDVRAHWGTAPKGCRILLESLQ